MSELLSSYSSANVFPAKILRHEKLIHFCLHQKKVFPIHLQLNVTNSCQLDCGFCSCGGRDKSLQLSLSEIEKIMTKARDLGCESTTCTGGGEFLLHKDVNNIFCLLDMLNIQIGLVTSGLLLDRIENKASKGIVWCRISSSDELPAQLERIGKTLKEWFEIIDNACEENPHIDWAFSYVLTDKPNFPFIQEVVNFADKHGFTHIRVVCNILNPNHQRMNALQAYLKRKNIDTSKVIFQPRSRYTHGRYPCWLPLAKPVLGADNFWYSCCGSQYIKLNKPRRDYEPLTRISKFQGVKGLVDFVERQEPFDGRICERCYYDNYNQILDIWLRGNIKHAKFI